MSYHDDSSVWPRTLTDAVTPRPPKLTRRVRQRDTVAVEIDYADKAHSLTRIRDWECYRSITDRG